MAVTHLHLLRSIPIEIALIAQDLSKPLAKLTTSWEALEGLSWLTINQKIMDLLWELQTHP